jgi:hypothetical protein
VKLCTRFFVLRALVERERETPEEELSRLTSRSRRTIYPSIFISSSFFQREERGGRYSGLNIIGGLILYFVKVEYKEKRTPGQIKVASPLLLRHKTGESESESFSPEKIKKTMG